LSVARTLMQHALPMPFGLRLAGYAAALGRSRERLTRLRREGLPLQFGGAAGTLAALGEHGFGVAERLAALLDLQLPDAPWHSHRDRLAEIASCMAILTGTCGKIAKDVALMMQIEVAEAFEPSKAGRGGSSTLPHKRNPMGAVAALSAATAAPNLVATLLAAMVQEHERGLGGWQTEWMTLPVLALVTSGALDAVVNIAEGLEIDIERLKTNLDLSGGQIMAEAVSFALAEKVGKPEAHRIVQELSQKAAKEKRPLKEALLADLRVRNHLGPLEVEKLFIPLTYQGSAQTFIDRLVAAAQTRTPRRQEPKIEIKSETKTDNWRDIRMVEPRLPTAPQLSQPPDAPAAEAPTPPAATTAAAADPPPAFAEPAAAPDLRVSSSDRIEPPQAAAAPDAPLPAAAPPPEVPPPEDDAPGALMDVLSRADAEAAARDRKS
jgi:3-carboxy-cis,cis-muconate cycloisomerase